MKLLPENLCLYVCIRITVLALTLLNRHAIKYSGWLSGNTTRFYHNCRIPLKECFTFLNIQTNLSELDLSQTENLHHRPDFATWQSLITFMTILLWYAEVIRGISLYNTTVQHVAPTCEFRFLNLLCNFWDQKITNVQSKVHTLQWSVYNLYWLKNK